MLHRSWTALAAALVVVAAAASAQVPPPGTAMEPREPPAGVAHPSPRGPNEPSAQQNVKESEQYEKLLCSNPAFLKKRINQECGPINDPQLHQQCLESFPKCGSGAASGPRVHPRRTPASER